MLQKVFYKKGTKSEKILRTRENSYVHVELQNWTKHWLQYKIITRQCNEQLTINKKLTFNNFCKNKAIPILCHNIRAGEEYMLNGKALNIPGWTVITNYFKTYSQYFDCVTMKLYRKNSAYCHIHQKSWYQVTYLL